MQVTPHETKATIVGQETVNPLTPPHSTVPLLSTTFQKIVASSRPLACLCFEASFWP